MRVGGSLNPNACMSHVGEGAHSTQCMQLWCGVVWCGGVVGRALSINESAHLDPARCHYSQATTHPPTARCRYSPMLLRSGNHSPTYSPLLLQPGNRSPTYSPLLLQPGNQSPTYEGPWLLGFVNLCSNLGFGNLCSNLGFGNLCSNFDCISFDDITHPQRPLTWA